MSQEGVLDVLEESSGEITDKNDLSDVIIENSDCVNSSYIIMGHSAEEFGNSESVNLCYKQIGGTIDDKSIIFNDIKSVEEWLKTRTDLEQSTADLELSRGDDWWNFCTTEIVTNDVNENIMLPPITDLSNNVVEEANVSNVNWEDYVLDSENYINSTSSILNNSFFIVPSNNEKSCENELEIHQVDGYLNPPNLIVSNAPTSLINESTICDVNIEKSIKEECIDYTSSLPNGFKPVSHINIQDTYKKLPFVKVPKDCLARGKILGKKAIGLSFFSGENTFYNKHILLRPTFSKTETVSSKQPSLLNIKTCSPSTTYNTIRAKEKQAVVIVPMQSAKKTQVNSLLKVKHPRSLLKINNTPNNHGVRTESFQKEVGKSKSIAGKSPVAVVAISTDKANDTTEIIIKTEEGENVFKGKTSDIMKATGSTNNLQNNALDPLQLDKNYDSETIKNLMVKLLGVTDEVLDGIVSTPTFQLQCPVDSCTFTTSKGSWLKVHILQHYGIRPFKCDYPSCTWAFYTKFRLKRHKEIHFKNKEFKCPVEGCGRCFSNSSNLKHHVKLHNRPTNLTCTVNNCNQAFQTRKSLEKHLKGHGEEYAPYTCLHEGCGKKYFAMSTLNAHSRLHQHSEDELKCSYCGKLFLHPCRLKDHVNAHIGVKPYKCDFPECVWSFSTSSKLRRHQRKHTQIRKHHCKICSRSYLRLEHLRDHSLKHFVKKTFVCNIADCRTVFVNKSSLYAHLKKHRTQEVRNEQATHPCLMENCYLIFTTAEDLRAHLQSGHGPSSGIVSFNSTSQEGLLVGMSDLVQCIPTSTAQGEFSESNSLNVITHVVFTDDQPEEKESGVSEKESKPEAKIEIEEGIGSARTGLTYQATVESKRQVTATTTEPPSTPLPTLGLHMASDVVLSAGLLTSQDTLDRSLLLQDELTGGDLYMGVGGAVQEENGLLGPAGELQVLLLDPTTRLQHSDFEQSTINLRDLE